MVFIFNSESVSAPSLENQIWGLSVFWAWARDEECTITSLSSPQSLCRTSSIASASPSKKASKTQRLCVWRNIKTTWHALHLACNVMNFFVLFCVAEATTVTRSQEGKFPSQRLPRTHKNRARNEKSDGETC